MSNTQDPIKRAISEAIGFEWTDGYLQTVNASDLLRLAAVIAALQSTARQPSGDEREAFEAWHEREYGSKPMCWSQTTEANRVPEAYLNRYIINDVEKAWKAWQAAIAALNQHLDKS